MAPLVVQIDTNCRLVASFTPRPLYSPRTRHSCPFIRRLADPQSRRGRL